MTKLSGEELDRKIAPIAGMVEGRDYWSKRPHQWVSPLRYASSIVEQCKLCGIFEDEPLTSLACHKSPPVYHESLDLIVPVVRKTLVEWKENRRWAWWNRFWLVLSDSMAEARGEEDIENLFVWVDNPAQLLAEALVEAVGGEND